MTFRIARTLGITFAGYLVLSLWNPNGVLAVPLKNEAAGPAEVDPPAAVLPLAGPSNQVESVQYSEISAVQTEVARLTAEAIRLRKKINGQYSRDNGEIQSYYSWESAEATKEALAEEAKLQQLETLYVAKQKFLDLRRKGPGLDPSVERALTVDLQHVQAEIETAKYVARISREKAAVYANVSQDPTTARQFRDVQLAQQIVDNQLLPWTSDKDLLEAGSEGPLGREEREQLKRLEGIVRGPDFNNVPYFKADEFIAPLRKISKIRDEKKLRSIEKALGRLKESDRFNP